MRRRPDWRTDSRSRRSANHEQPANWIANRLEGLGKKFPQPIEFIGAGGRNRTGTGLPPTDFKSVASTNSATPALGRRLSRAGAEGQNPERDSRKCKRFRRPSRSKLSN